jgi:hypothetical protein
MRSVTITIQMEGAAFADDEDGELFRILNRLAEQAAAGNDIGGSLRDSNGNRCGQVSVFD